MYGCPHVRCQCGAHWCWDCQRPMNACYEKPCRAARDAGNHSDGAAEEADSDDDNTATVPQAEARVSADASLVTLQTPPTEAGQDVVVETLSSLRSGAVVNANSAEDPLVGPGPVVGDTAPSIVAHELGAAALVPSPQVGFSEGAQSRINEPGRTLTRSYTDMTPAASDAFLDGLAGPTPHQSTTRFAPE